MNPNRYTVQPVRGMCLGAGGFVVIDTVEGREVFHPVLWRDDAERIATRLNAQEHARQQEAA